MTQNVWVNLLRLVCIQPMLRLMGTVVIEMKSLRVPLNAGKGLMSLTERKDQDMTTCYNKCNQASKRQSGVIQQVWNRICMHWIRNSMGFK
jgi:hypothetical protein